MHGCSQPKKNGGQLLKIHVPAVFMMVKFFSDDWGPVLKRTPSRTAIFFYIKSKILIREIGKCMGQCVVLSF